VTRRSDEAIVDWQHDDAELDEAAHDRLSHICIPPLEANAGVRVKYPGDRGVPELDGLD
jgi:hypothetical protein